MNQKSRHIALFLMLLAAPLDGFAQVVEKSLLVSPENGSVDQPLSVTLRWKSAAGASDYQLQVSTASDFSTILVDRSGINGTSSVIGPLERGQNYFWRVRGFFLAVPGAWSDVWRFTTIPNPPATPKLLSPHHNSVLRPPSVALMWNRDSTAATYRIQISRDSTWQQTICDSTVASSTSLLFQPLQYSSVYFWRIQASNPGGNSEWSSTFRFATVPAPPSAPALYSPAQSAINQPVSVRLVWLKSEQTSSYHVQLSLRSDLAQCIVDSFFVTDTTFLAELLLKDTSYYWRVAAVNTGGEGNWSAIRSFSTVPSLPTMPIISTPADGAYIDTTAVFFAWYEVPRTSTYWLQISKDSLFETIVFNDVSISGKSHRVSGLLFNQNYFWRVRGTNAGGSGAWSNISRFITRSSDSYAGPVLQSPSDGSYEMAQSIRLEWKPVFTALSYHLQIGNDANFTSLVLDTATLLSTAVEVGPLKEGMTYYWRVRSDYIVFTSEWSDRWSFTTIPNQPQTPQLGVPSANALHVPTSVAFQWYPVPSAQRYHLQVAANPDFNLLIVNDTSVTDTVCRVGSLTNQTQFFWRVAAINAGGKSTWSTAWSFTTENVLPPPPVPTQPPNGEKLSGNSVTISWNADSLARAYQLLIAADSAFGSVVYNDSTITQTSQTVTGLVPSTLYFWKVRSRQSQSSSQWSSPSSFSTGSAAPSAGPVLISPPDNALDVPTDVTLQWTQDAGAISYHVQLSKNWNFSPIIFENSSVSETSQLVASLDNSTAYYWRVRSNYLLVSSDWSAIWKFTTENGAPVIPALIAPADGATGQPLTMTLQWSAAAGANRYHVRTALDSAFASIVLDDSTLTASSTTMNNLTVNKKYFWKVRAGNGGRWSAFSAVRNFTTKQGDLPAAVTLAATNLTSTSATLNAIVSANGYATTVRFQYGTSSAYGNSVDGIPLLIPDTATATLITNTLHGLTPNTTYHYRVSTTNQLGSTEGEDRSFRTLLPPYPGLITINATFPFPSYRNPSDYKPTDYRIIGLPGNSNIRSDSLLSQIPRSDWEMYWDMGDGERTLISFDGSRHFTFTTGRAFWFIKKGPLTIQRTIPTAPLDSTQEILIPLHSGWNLITNPFDSVIAWSVLQKVNSLNQPIYSFNGGFALSDTLHPYSGYYLFNDSDKKELRVPYSAFFASSIPDTNPTIFAKSSETSWSASIALRSEDYRDHSTWFGIGDHSRQKQYHKPARFSMLPSVYFDRPEWNSAHRTFATDFRPSVENCQSWDFTVWNPRQMKTDLTFSGFTTIPPQYDVYLIDAGAHRSVDLRADSVYRFYPAGQTTALRIVIGTPDSVRRIVRSIGVPASFSIGNNYPNPFNPETTIPVSVPQRTGIVISIINLLGQTIRTLHSGELDPGIHWLRWDGKDKSGTMMSSGVYFCRAASSSGVALSRKMLLTK